MGRLLGLVAICLIIYILPACSLLPRLRSSSVRTSRPFSTDVLLDGKRLELHVSKPITPIVPDVMVLYATGDGGWFGAAIDMFQEIADAGYPVAGFSSRAFLRIERPKGALVSSRQLAAEYAQIISAARTALGLGDTSGVVLAGWSRGAAFSVLVGSEHDPRDRLLGVIAIGLIEGEDLQASDADDGPDDDQPAEQTPAGKRRWPFDTYGRIAQLDPLPCAVIQATKDNYLPAARAQQLFGADTPRRRFYAIEARNHRFSGGKAAFNHALRDSITWMTSPAPEARPVP